MYFQGVQGPPRHGDRRDARTRRVGGGHGDGGGYCAPAGGRFAGRAPGRPQYGHGPRDRGFQGFDAPRFPRGGDRRPRSRRDMGFGMIDIANPSIEKIARH